MDGREIESKEVKKGSTVRPTPPDELTIPNPSPRPTVPPPATEPSKDDKNYGK